MTDFIPSSPMVHRQFGTPFDINSGEFKPHKRCRSTLDDYDECRIEEEECGYDFDRHSHVEFNPEKRIRNNSFSNGSVGSVATVSIEERQQDYVNAEKRSRPNSIRSPTFSSHGGFSFNDSSTTILRLEGELRHERQEMQVKEEQLHMAHLENKSISDQIKVVEARSTKLNEENTILKRAVNIQENRMKELNQHNQQLQQILAQAAQRIAQLENAQGGRRDADEISSIFGHGPPDVY